MSHAPLKASLSNLRATAASSFGSKSSTYLIIGNASAVVYVIQMRSFFANRSALPKMRDQAGVSQQKVFSKNQIFPSLSGIEKLVMAIATVPAFETDMAIVTVLAIKTVMTGIIVKASSGIKPAIGGLRDV